MSGGAEAHPAQRPRRRVLYIAGAAMLLAATLALSAAASGYWIFTARTPGAFFDSAGAALHFTDEGEGPPVVLLHGFAAHADLNWRRAGITALLRERYRVIALDLRGHGLSAKPHAPEEYGAEMARDVARLLDHLEIGQAHIVGYSLGGFVALRFATLYPERTLSALPLGAGWEHVGEGGALENFREAGEALAAGRGIRPPSGALGEERVRTGPVHNAFVWLLTRYFNDGRALAAVLLGAGGLAVSEEEIRAITAPVCCIAGSEDPLVVGVHNLREALPQARVVIIDGASHFTAVRHPEFREALLDCLDAFSR